MKPQRCSLTERLSRSPKGLRNDSKCTRDQWNCSFRDRIQDSRQQNLSKGRSIPQIGNDERPCAPSAPRWCFGSSGLTTNPNTCRTQWDHRGVSALHPIHGVSSNSKDGYSGCSPPNMTGILWEAASGSNGAKRTSHSHDPGASSQRGPAPLLRRLFARHPGILLNGTTLTSSGWIG